MKMGSEILNYKGYYTRIEFSSSDKVLHGKIEGISDLVTFESDSSKEIENEFHSAVDDYLEFCKEVGKDPAKAYNGSFNVRISPMLHKSLAKYAFENGCSLNSSVEKAISEMLSGNNQVVESIESSISVLADAVNTANYLSVGMIANRNTFNQSSPYTIHYKEAMSN